MARPPQISRSFPVLTLLMAVPLIVILGYVVYTRYVAEDAATDGWKTHRNERFKFEITYPPTWEVARNEGVELMPGVPAWTTEFVDRAVPTPDVTRPRSVSDPPLVFPPSAQVLINPQADWCLQRTTRTEITVSGVSGTEAVCFWYGSNMDACEPQPQCREQPLGIIRWFDRQGTTYWVLSNVSASKNPNNAAEFEVARRVVQSFRFVD